MQAYTITLGIGETRNGSPITSHVRDVALLAVRSDLAHAFGGYTETFTRGGWINPDGRLVTEPGRAFTVFTDESGGAFVIRSWARRVGQFFNQDSVCLTLPNGSVEILRIHYPTD